MITELLIRLFERFIRPRFRRAYGRMLLRRVGHVGVDVRLHGMMTITDPANLSLGDYVRVGTGCFFFCKGGLTIGANTQISRNVVIYTGNHDIAGGAVPYDDQYVTESVSIGRSVWIGMNAAILPGVKIGDGAVIGLGAVVSKDVPPGAIVVGAPQRVVRYRDMNEFNELVAAGRLFGRLWPNN